MNKCLLSLMLLVSSWAWGAEVLPHDGAAETKGGLETPSVVMEAPLAYYKEAKKSSLEAVQNKFAIVSGEKVWLLPIQASIFKSGLIQDQLGIVVRPDGTIKETKDSLIEPSNEIDLFKRYDDVVISAVMHYLVDEPVDWSVLSATELVKALQLQSLLQIEVVSFDDWINSKLYNAIANQLLNRSQNDSTVLDLLQNHKMGRLEYLKMFPGINLSQTIPGDKAVWSPDGSKLWIRFWGTRTNPITNAIQLYQVADDRLVAVDAASIFGYNPYWSPDGSKLWEIFYSNDGWTFRVHQVASDGLVAVDAASIRGYDLHWSPDGSRLLGSFSNYYDERQIQMYQIIAGRLESLGDPVPGDLPGWSPDGSKLWVQLADHDRNQMGVPVPGDYAGWGSDGSRLWVAFRGIGMRLYQFINSRLTVPGDLPRWSPAGSKLWVWNNNWKFRVYQVTPEGLESVGTISGNNPCWSPDGSKFFIHFWDGRISQSQVYRVANGRLAAMGDPVRGDYAIWSPDGSKLRVSYRDNHVVKIQVYQITKEGLRVVGAAVSSCNLARGKASWSPDGSRLLESFTNRDGITWQIQVYKITAGGLEVLGDPVPGTSARWSLDGSKLRVRFKDHGAQSWNVGEYKIQVYRVADDGLGALGSAVPEGNAAGWSPDGSKFFIANGALSQITVYFDPSHINLDQLLKRFIPDSSLVQQMFLAYTLQEYQRTGTPYQIPAELINIWNSLPKALRARLIVTGKVILGKQLLRLGHCEE